MANKIKLRRGLHQNLPVLEVGEPAFTTDTKELYIGTAIGNVLIGAKVDDATIKINEQNKIYVDEISMAKVAGLIDALNGIVPGDENVQSDWNQSDNTKDDYIKNKPSIPTVPVISTNIDTDALSDTKTASPKAVKTYVDGKVATVYKASGSLTPVQVVSGLLIAANAGNVYNITAELTTTADFVEGAGNKYPAGTNIVVVLVGAVYKFDVLSGFIDTSSFLTAVPKATASVLGGIKVGYTNTGRKHKVELDSSDKAFVDLTDLLVDGGEWA